MRRTPAIILGIWSAIATTSAISADGRPPSEASMLVTGTLELNGDGSVRSYTVDHQEKLPASVTEVIHKNAPAWKFQPPDPEESSGKMTLRIVARPIDDKRDSVNIAGATFGDVQAADGKHIRYNNTSVMPFYPKYAFYGHETATVYVLVQIGRNGKAHDVFAEQVNLGAYASKSEMDGYRRIFAEASTKAIREWTFVVPTRGKTADAPFWYIRIPVVFDMADRSRPLPDDYGKWHVYVPGPRRQPPWLRSRATVSTASPDAISNGSLQQLDTGMQLVSALEGG